MAFAIKVFSKWEGRGGRPLHLGTKYPTREAEQAAGNAEICGRCNVFDVYPVSDDWEWKNRDVGFAAPRKAA